MNKSLLLIFLIVFFILMICIHIYNTWFQSTKEGMGSSDINVEYTYYPNKTNPNLKKPVKINYLVKETTDMLVFLKKKQNLIYVPPPEPVEVEPPVVDDYTDDTPSAEAAFAPPPDPNAPQPAPTAGTTTTTTGATTGSTGTVTTTTTVSPAPAPAPAPVPAPEEPESPEFENEYSKPLQSLDIYAKYDNYRNPNSMTEELEKIYGEMFNSEKLKIDEETIYKKFQTNIAFYNDAYNYTKHFLIQKIHDKSYNKQEFTFYIIELVRKHKESQSVLDEIKSTFYKIIDTSFGFNRLCAYFKENRKIYTKKDDALFIINTALKHLKSANYAEINSKNGNVHFTSEDKDDLDNRIVLFDAIKYTDVARIVYDLVLLIAYKVSDHLYISFDEFVRSYKEHVSSKQIDSFYLFLIENPPEIDLL